MKENGVDLKNNVVILVGNKSDLKGKVTHLLYPRKSKLQKLKAMLRNVATSIFRLRPVPARTSTKYGDLLKKAVRTSLYESGGIYGGSATDPQSLKMTALLSL